jgi:hypothetical protein
MATAMTSQEGFYPLASFSFFLQGVDNIFLVISMSVIFFKKSEH